VVTADPSAANLKGLGNLELDTNVSEAGRVGHVWGVGVPVCWVSVVVDVPGVVGVIVVVVTGGTVGVVDVVVVGDAVEERHWEYHVFKKTQVVPETQAVPPVHPWPPPA
jgi:hypothetical protein